MKLADIKKHFWSFSLILGFLSAFILALVITVWEWIENPSGIFHNQYETNWSFVYATFKSWFVPTFINATIISCTIYLLVKLIKYVYTRNK